MPARGLGPRVHVLHPGFAAENADGRDRLGRRV